MVNSLLYIAGLFRCFNPALCHSDRGCGIIFGTLLVCFCLGFAGAANVAQAKSASYGSYHCCDQPYDRFNTHSDLTPTQILPG
jgi:hypothetical protein